MTTPTISPIAEQIINTLHTRIDQLIAERDELRAKVEAQEDVITRLKYEVDAIPAIKAERDALAAAAKLALEALIESHTSDDGMAKWDRNKAAIASLRQAGVQ